MPKQPKTHREMRETVCICGYKASSPHKITATSELLKKVQTYWIEKFELDNPIWNHVIKVKQLVILGINISFKRYLYIFYFCP